MSSTVLVTGAGKGFGRLITLTLLKKGHKVIGTLRDLQGRNAGAAAELRQAGAELVEMDVTDEAGVDRAIQGAIRQAGRLDAVVNNAGVGVLGIQETFTIEDFKRVFDINVFGVHRVNRAVLPHMRQRGEGLLIQISSLLGRMTIPFYGPYNATKWAVEAMAENYRTELAGFGVDVCIVEPGGFPTSFMDALIKPGDAARLAAYGDFARAPEQSLEAFEGAMAKNPRQNPQLVADAVAKLVETPAGSRPFRTAVDTMGMGAAIAPYNDLLKQITEQIYGAFGMAPMLQLKTKAAAQPSN